MKKVLKLFFVLFLFLLCGGCAARRTPIPLPQVSSPAAERAGVHFQGTPFQVSNSSPFFCSLVAGGKDLGLVGPGGLVFDQRHWHNLWVQYIPVAAVCYRDAELMQYVGAAGRVFAFSEYAPVEWIIRPGEIRTPDGRIPAPAPTTSASTMPRSRKIELPREALSTLGVQVVNNTTSDISVFVNGVRRGTVATGGAYYAPVELVGNFSRPLIITIVGAGNCTYTEQVWVQRYSQWVRQVIFGPEHCGFSQRGWR